MLKRATHVAELYFQDGCEPDSSGRRQMCDMMTQTSTVELPREAEEKNETDDEKKKNEKESNGGVVGGEKKRDKRE